MSFIANSMNTSIFTLFFRLFLIEFLNINHFYS
jgi:hypothetical protein